MKKLNFLFVLGFLTFIANSSFCQAPSIQWERSYGGTLNEDNYCVKQTSDGGYITCGNALSFDGDCSSGASDTTEVSKMWVVKTDSIGNIQWQKKLPNLVTSDGPLIFPDDYAYSIIENSNGQFVIAGGGGGSDPSTFAIVVLSNTGTILNSLSIGCDDGTLAHDIIQTKDGGYLVVGNINQDADTACGVSPHNPPYLSGEYSSQDWWILKLNANLDIQWQKRLGSVIDSISSGNDALYACQQTTDSGYVLAGASGGGHNYDVPLGTTTDISYSDAWIIKLDKDGNILWNKVYGGGWYDEANSIQQTFDKGYIVGGFYKENSGDLSSFPLDYGSWIFKLDSLGNMQWQKADTAFGYSESFVAQKEDSSYVLLTNDGGINGGGDYIVYKYNKYGDFLWKGQYGGEDNEYPSSIAVTNDGGYIISGTSLSTGGEVTNHHGEAGSWDFWLVKLYPDGNQSNGISNITLQNSISLYPNPISSSLYINYQLKHAQLFGYSISTLSGEDIFKSKYELKQSGIHKESIDLTHIPNGVYIMKFIDGSIKKIVVIH